MSRKQELADAITTEVRRSQIRTDAYDDAVAIALGVNRTDYRCIDALDVEGPMTAGRLAAVVGISSAAMTTALDRLERAGIARRRRDEHDRRRVVVEIDPDVRKRGWSYYEPMARMGAELIERFTVAELEIVLRFLREANELATGSLDELHRRLAAK